MAHSLQDQEKEQNATDDRSRKIALDDLTLEHIKEQRIYSKRVATATIIIAIATVVYAVISVWGFLRGCG